MAIIKLGNFDPTPTTKSRINDFLAAIHHNLELNEAPGKIRDDSSDGYRTVAEFEDSDLMSIQELQDALDDAGFLPGGLEKGFYGYRTRAAVRLFQEYIRVYENVPLDESWPDGIYGSKTDKHLRRWKDKGLKANWIVTKDGKKGLVARWQEASSSNNPALLEGTEYLNWLSFLDDVKSHYQRNPSRMIKMINDFEGNTDTIKVDDWDFGLDHIHMIGIRRGEQKGKGRGSDDVMLLLIKGMVYKFQGSTDPGKSDHTFGPPFLVQGQHNYHFGWHKKGAASQFRSYLALRPQNHGVLVARSKDFKLTDSDLDRGLETNKTINIHWGGRGGRDKVIEDKFPWSAGCQVITGTGYLNHFNEPVDCSSYRAATPDEPFTSKKTRGAYNVLADLVTALSGDMEGTSVKYMLLMEEDLNLSEFASKTIKNALGFRSKMK